MKPIHLSVFGILLVLASQACLTNTADRTEEPQSIFPVSEVPGFQLSPDGAHLAWLTSEERALRVRSTEGGEAFGPPEPVLDFAWAGPGELLYITEDNGWLVKRVNMSGGVDVLTSSRKDQFRLVRSSERTLDLLRGTPEKGFEPVVFAAGRPGLSKLPPGSGSWTQLLRDDMGAFRAAMERNESGQILYYRQHLDSSWHQVGVFPHDQNLQLLRLSDDKRHRALAISDLNRERPALVKMDLQQGEELELLFEHQQGAVLKAEGRASGLVYIHYGDGDRERCWYLNQAYREAADYLAEAYGASELLLETAAMDLVFVFRTLNDGQLSYYLVDMRTQDPLAIPITL